ncbi:MAG: hypothetical protein LBB23_01900 [Rickettsiales bacterium]|jgi:hypothetical protein|nr:hypothetical protein [Rickettsiales bacterium]
MLKMRALFRSIIISSLCLGIAYPASAEDMRDTKDLLKELRDKSPTSFDILLGDNVSPEQLRTEFNKVLECKSQKDVFFENKKAGCKNNKKAKVSSESGANDKDSKKIEKILKQAEDAGAKKCIPEDGKKVYHCCDVRFDDGKNVFGHGSKNKNTYGGSCQDDKVQVCQKSGWSDCQAKASESTEQADNQNQTEQAQKSNTEWNQSYFDERMKELLEQSAKWVADDDNMKLPPEKKKELIDKWEQDLANFKASMEKIGITVK